MKTILQQWRKAIYFAITIALLVAGLVLPTAMAASAATFTVPLRGDVNLDGNIGGADVTLLRQQQAGLRTFSATQMLAADVNKDGNVSGADVTLLRQVMAHIPGRTISDTYFIKNKQTRKFLTVGGVGGVGAPVIQSTFSGSTMQQWLVEFSEGVYHVRPKHNISTYLIGTSPVVLGSTSSIDNWGVEGNGDDTYSFWHIGDTCFSIMGATGSTNVTLQLDHGTPATNEKWELAHAGVFWVGGVANRSIALQLANTTAQNGTWSPLIMSSCVAWNNANAGVNLYTTTTTSNYKIYVDAYYWPDDPTAAGLTTLPSNGTVYSSKVEINTNNIFFTSEYRRSVIAHEIGHMFWLGHNAPVFSTGSIMKSDRDRDTLFVPQPYDAWNVRFRYD